jgi:hypothetical protein
MTCTVTVTAKTGPAKQMTAAVFTDVTAFTIDVHREVIELYQKNTPISGPSQKFDLHGVTTISDTITSGNHVVTIS